MADAERSLRLPPVTHQFEHDSDEEAEQPGYIKATDYSLPYISQWSRLHHNEPVAELLRQVNCNFLSTPEVPPTLLSLKQHAQALCILLMKLVPTLRPGEVDVDNLNDPLALRADRNDAFDWLSDLQTPYQNADPDHQKPLISLLNEVKGRSDALGTEYHCPLSTTQLRGRCEPVQPFANLHNLIMHTNECLERLDHEFSSEGGLMGMLPTDEDYEESDRKDARNCLLGQWLVFTQHLVGRMHELEIAYGNALDALNGEAVAPMQHLSTLGPDGRSGREIAYPQDRWLLVNAGDDIFEHIHSIMDRQEALVKEKERIYTQNGVRSETRWMNNRGGKTYARGIIPVNIMTRYYRIAGQGRSTLFVLPAWEHNLSVEHTKALEKNPTVVSAVQPKFPVRFTELESRLKKSVERAQTLELTSMKLGSNVAKTHEQVKSLEADLERERAANRALEGVVGQDNHDLAAEVAKLRVELEKAKGDLAYEQTGKQRRQADNKRLTDNLAARNKELAEADKLIAALKHQLDQAAKESPTEKK